MKELEKTNRISISAVLFLLVIIIGILTFKRPKHVFSNDSIATLNEVIEKNYILSLDDFTSQNNEEYVLVDIRSIYEFEKGHIKNAINIPTNQILEDENISIFKDAQKTNETVILYGENPDQANSAWMLLYQLGYENLKILSIETSYYDKNFQISNYEIEKPNVDYRKAMDSAKIKIVEVAIAKPMKPVSKPSAPAPKKVVPVKKKKKAAPEGGC